MKSAALAKLPDVHRWVEARATLLAPEGRVFGMRTGDEASFVVREHASSAVFVVGLPDRGTLHAALARPPRATEAIVGIEHAAVLATELHGWERSRIVVHALRHPERLPPPDERVRFLDPDRIPRLAIDEELKQKLEIGAQGSDIAAYFVDDAPVAFCYVGAITETLWDVAIGTVEAHRRRGRAGCVAAHMIRHMQATGRRAPVWQAVDENPASSNLAAKLGFEVVDELVQFRHEGVTSR